MLSTLRFVALITMALSMLAACGGGPSENDVVSDGGRRIVPVAELADVGAIQLRHLDSVNALRQARGAAPLVYDQALNSAALTHARDMALQQRAWHFGSDRSNPQSRARRAGFGGRTLGENKDLVGPALWRKPLDPFLKGSKLLSKLECLRAPFDRFSASRDCSQKYNLPSNPARHAFPHLADRG